MVGALRSPLGAVVARPSFDRAALWGLANWFFPVSRLWAAADAADGVPEQFFAEVPMQPASNLAASLEKKLATFERVRTASRAADAAWEAAFFGSGQMAPNSLPNIENARISGRHALNTLRRLFLPLRRYGRAAPIRWDIPGPDEVEAAYGRFLADPAGAFVVPDPMPQIFRSPSVELPSGTSYWLRFASPSQRLGDQVTARVFEPVGVKDPPTLIFGHGVCVDFDHWRGVVDEVAAMVDMGIRVVRPEAPWHGRRISKGSYGGERFIATAPGGALDLFTSAVREWAVLIDWCRRTTNAPVAVGGSSLGAMTAQILADKARNWPQALRPDAMFLVTHCGHIEDAVLHGAFARVWRIAEATMAHGWTPESVHRYMPLFDALGEPVVAPENIVSVLGSHDVVTPFSSARQVVDEWRLPPDNTFIWRCGHFSIPVALMRNHAPLRRLHDILCRMA